MVAAKNVFSLSQRLKQSHKDNTFLKKGKILTLWSRPFHKLQGCDNHSIHPYPGNYNDTSLERQNDHPVQWMRHSQPAYNTYNRKTQDRCNTTKNINKYEEKEEIWSKHVEDLVTTVYLHHYPPRHTEYCYDNVSRT